MVNYHKVITVYQEVKMSYKNALLKGLDSTPHAKPFEPPRFQGIFGENCIVLAREIPKVDFNRMLDAIAVWDSNRELMEDLMEPDIYIVETNSSYLLLSPYQEYCTCSTSIDEIIKEMHTRQIFCAEMV